MFHWLDQVNIFMKTRKLQQVIALVTLLVLLPLHTVFADSEDPPENPGAGDDQDDIISDGISWLFPEYGAIWIDLNDPSVDVTLDWSSLAIAGKIKTSDDHYVFVGIDSTSTTYILDEETHDEYHPGQGEGGGFAFGLGQLKNLAGCNTVWVDPGEIVAAAEKTGPEYPVVVGQDPDDTGVYLTYTLEIQPTILYYEKWGKIAEVQACINDENPDDILEMECEVKPNGTVQCKDTGACPEGYSKQHTQLWGCKVEQKEYRESITSVTPQASLTAASRDWILGDLAGAYPGTYLKHPVWVLGADTDCIWNSDTCTWTYSESSIPVEDPGWYDLIVSGVTSGTTISPPRTFRFTLGDFGVFFIDTSSSG